MANILIMTRTHDVHSVYVSVGLEQLGHRALRWFSADFPVQDSLTATVSNVDDFAWRLEPPAGAVEGPFDTVWNRRRAPSAFPADRLPDSFHADDLAFVQQECGRMVSSIWYSIEPDAFWVNPIEHATRAANKLLQLRVAKEIGLAIPKTCASNNPDDIRMFLASAGSSGAIYKPFLQGHWDLDDGGHASLSTKAVTLDQLPSDEVLRLTPGIFQTQIPKAYEVRATFMGRHCAAVAIDSQSDARTQQDWRVVNPNELKMQVIRLPDDVYEKSIDLMRRLGLVFGCFDFIVTPNGDYVFLEVNEMGQFTWVELSLPELKLVDMMCCFLASSNPDFLYDYPSNPISIADILSSERFKTLWAERHEAHVADADKAP
ncbi:MAG: MvdC/MvdD family ATP grasp protein [Maricaulaceae bacterium]